MWIFDSADTKQPRKSLIRNMNYGELFEASYHMLSTCSGHPSIGEENIFIM